MTDPTEPPPPGQVYRRRDRRLDRKLAKLIAEYGPATVTKRARQLAKAWGKPLTLPAVSVTRGGVRYPKPPTYADDVAELLTVAESLSKRWGVFPAADMLRGLAADLAKRNGE